jgi:hypothetical protein
VRREGAPQRGSSSDGGVELLRDELRTVDEELVGLRVEVERLRGQFGARSDGPVDPAENAAALTNVEEQEALIGVLERRREDLVRRLAEG